MKRAALRVTPNAAKLNVKPRLRKCKVCRGEFEKRSMSHVACSPACAMESAKRRREALERRDIRLAKLRLKPRSQWLAEAQTAFNGFIRARDAGKPCICCGKPFEPQKPGGSVDAGHYRSRGSAPHLRFDERNCFSQRKNCNRPGGTTHAAFRKGVEARIGLEALEALEADQESRDLSIDALKAIKALYKEKLKEMKASNGAR